MAGISTVVAMLKESPKRLQRLAIQAFVNRELAELRRQASTPAAVTGSNIIKLYVSSQRRGPKEPRAKPLAI
uniref:Uncharacterized protein n=1 Tax=Hyaloperonospora arabidopsidis (strain Emoy2) TaxID=559515 RepID=M4B9N9_HYAAE